MIYATIVRDAEEHLPELRAFDEAGPMAGLLDEEPPMPYAVFGTEILPMLEGALEEGRLMGILRVCAFFEEVAIASRDDAFLEELLRVEVGEWLGCTEYQREISPWLGVETKRVCRYVSGLATQRNEVAGKRAERGLMMRLRRFLSELVGSRG